MSLLLAVYVGIAFALQAQLTLIDGALWAGTLSCAALASRRYSIGSVTALGATAAAILLGSLALVAP